MHGTGGLVAVAQAMQLKEQSVTDDAIQIKSEVSNRPADQIV
jgi:hypothetical protein